MLSVVPDLSPEPARVQVFGFVGIHYVGSSEIHRLTNSGQRLLAVLVAAGIAGATSERIAEEIWGSNQPDPWRPALRMAVARLRKLLPDGWDVVFEGGVYSLNPAGGGWIDAWRLTEVAAGSAAIDEEDLHWALAGQPFREIDALEMVGAAAQNLQMLQVAVAERFCSQAPTSLTTRTCSVLTSLLRDHPYSDSLAETVGRALNAAGRRAEATMAIAAFSKIYLAEFDALSPGLKQLLADDVATPPDASPSDSVGEAVMPRELQRLADVPMVGRDLELDDLRRHQAVFLAGVTGSGKSTLLAALVAAEPAVETTYIVGDSHLDVSLAPLATAIPALRDELLLLAAADTAGEPDAADRKRTAFTKAWHVMLRYLERRSEERPQRLLIDDAHQLDELSLGVVRLLMRSHTDADIAIVVAGSTETDEIGWIELLRDVDRAGMVRVELTGLNVEAIEQIIYHHLPATTHQARHGLAVDIYEASNGLPAVVAAIVAAVDPQIMALPDHVSGTSALARLVTSTSALAAEVVGAAAVLGSEFSIGDLLDLTELSEVEVFEVLDDLWSNGTIVESDDPNVLRFRHVLVQQAALENVPLFRRSQLHRRAGELTADVHARADHYAHATALVPSGDVFDALRASAVAFAERRRWRQVDHEIRRVHGLHGEMVDVELLTLWATARDLTGGDGSEPRRQAFDIASSTGDWSQALGAALSGLPAAELPDGDRDRVEMLLSIPEEALEQPDRFRRAYYLGREYARLADQSQMRQWVDWALALSSDPDERAATYLLRWVATRHVEPPADDIPADAGRGVSAHVQLQLAYAAILNRVERGEFEQAERDSHQFMLDASEVGEPLRVWHAARMNTMFLLNEGRFAEAEDAARDSLKYAELHGMTNGVSAYVGQQVFNYDMQDRLHDLRPMLEPFRADLEGVTLGRIALIVCDYAAGERDLGAALREIASEVVERRPNSAYALLATLQLASLLPQYTPEFVAPARARLEQFGDNPIVAGFGGASFGPTVRYVALLCDDLAMRRTLVTQAVAAADRHGPLLWRVRCRLDAAELGIDSALDEARQLATGTELADVVARRAMDIG